MKLNGEEHRETLTAANNYAQRRVLETLRSQVVCLAHATLPRSAACWQVQTTPAEVFLRAACSPCSATAERVSGRSCEAGGSPQATAAEGTLFYVGRRWRDAHPLSDQTPVRAPAFVSTVAFQAHHSATFRSLRTGCHADSDAKTW